MLFLFTSVFSVYARKTRQDPVTVHPVLVCSNYCLFAYDLCTFPTLPYTKEHAISRALKNAMCFAADYRIYFTQRLVRVFSDHFLFYGPRWDLSASYPNLEMELKFSFANPRRAGVQKACTPLQCRRQFSPVRRRGLAHSVKRLVRIFKLTVMPCWVDNPD
eukprot:g5201.t1